MAYRTLYRVFRPRAFDEVYGQAHITDILKKQVAGGKIAHAYLFYGPRGTGKTSTARILANAINCQNPVDGNPCGQCEVCTSFLKDAFVDIIEIDAASNNSVDNIRDLRERIMAKPILGKYKVYIIDEVHMLSTGAFNALLKTLEEPPSHAVLILATTELRKLPPTILSRCQRYDFKRITPDDIVARLNEVAQQAGITCEPQAITALAQAAEGSLRDALSLLDQCAAGRETLTLEEVNRTIGTADSALISGLAAAVLEENPGQALQLMQQMMHSGAQPQNILRDLTVRLSALLAENVSNSYACANILRALEVFIGMQGTMRFSYTPGAVLASGIVRAAVNTTDVDTKDFELRIKKLEQRVEKLATPPSAQVPRQEGAPSGAVQQRISQAGEKKATPEKSVEQTAIKAGADGSDEPKAKPQAKDDDPAPVQAAQPQAVQADDDTLARFKERVQAKLPAMGPAAQAVRRIEIKEKRADLFIKPEDMPLGEMLTRAENKQAMDEVTQEVFGQPKMLHLEAEQREQEDMRQILFEAFGVDNVTIKE